MRSVGLLFAAFLLISLPVTLAQDNPDDKNNPFRQLLAKMTPEVRVRYERLRKAEFASLELVRRPLELRENPEKLAQPYQEAEPVYFRLLITNNSVERVVFSRVDIYQENRPQLTRDGDSVAYRNKIPELLVEKDRDIMGRRVNSVILEPGETTEEYVKLGDWYEPLPPGRYQLTVRRRFIYGGDWIESPTIMFEVEPKRDKVKAESKHADASKN